MSTILNIETFKPLLHSKFKITFDEQNEYEVELIEVQEGKHIASLNLNPFTLSFRGAPTEKIFVQGIYSAHSETTGDMSLFLIPRLPDKEGIYYDCHVT